jgi:stalled ribosome rescue protein Dom34
MDYNKFNLILQQRLFLNRTESNIQLSVLTHALVSAAVCDAICRVLLQDHLDTILRDCRVPHEIATEDKIMDTLQELSDLACFCMEEKGQNYNRICEEIERTKRRLIS